MQYGLQDIFLNKVLDNYFKPENPVFLQRIYIGLGLSTTGGQANTDDFIEPTDTVGYSRQAIRFTNAVNGIAYNSTSINFGPAVTDWTDADHVIDKIGIFYVPEVGTEELWCVLPLSPTEQVLTGNAVVINRNTIRLQLTNR